MIDHGDHSDYDGIEELDNPLPGWWSGIFIVTIIFAAGYAWYYHLGGPGDSIHEKFDEDWKGYVAWKAAADEKSDVVVTEDLLATWAHDPKVLESGRAIFTKNCAGCHLEDGRGQIGPNLTDEFQIHGAQRVHLYETIRHGVPDTAMLPWEQTMQPRELAQVAAFVSSLRGRKIPGKEPQGTQVGPLE